MIKYIKYTFYFLSISSIFIYRYYWSTVSQWREDQATNIWLAYTKNISDIPVGLLSSKMIPTPNGIIIYGKILGNLPPIALWESISSAYYYSYKALALFYPDQN